MQIIERQTILGREIRNRTITPKDQAITLREPIISVFGSLITLKVESEDRIVISKIDPLRETSSETLEGEAINTRGIKKGKILTTEYKFIA